MILVVMGLRVAMKVSLRVLISLISRGQMLELTWPFEWGHFCPGALLARQEMMSSFSALIKRLDNIQLAKPLPEPVHNFSLFFLPMKEFYVKFTKAEI